MTGTKGLIRFQVERGDLHYLASLEAPMFDLLGIGQRLYSAIYKSLAPYDLKLADIKLDGPTANPGDAQVSCYLLDFRFIVRYRLERIEVWTDRPAMLGQEELGELIERAVGAGREASEICRPLVHTVTAAVHGKLQAAEIEAILGRFVTTTPPGSPPLQPGGVSFVCQWPGGEGESSIVLERSAVIQNGAFLKMTSAHPAVVRERDAYRRAMKFFDAAADRLGLEVEW